ncbi:PREDICTED: aspartyl protease UND-like [Camelina sativa]|uniref:Aspartyl protease UND-like n=1 Tax=Camelina sativa TaxID=90675 RepID=A0ABM0V5J9_CAMSA|nr:PREDICTED: aspartyl protease UND-like [Camelina sativa]
MAIFFTTPLVYDLIILCFSTSVVLLSASPTLVLNLVHSNQMHSSQEPPYVSRSEKASIARLEYSKAKATGDIIAHLSPNVPIIPQAFLVNISIGSPPVTQLLHMDTGSDLLWLQCQPCINCYDQSLPIFDPSRSYTHRNQSCITSEYSMPSLRFNSKSRSCEYSMRYMDDTGSKGILAKDTLVFNTIYDESSSASLPNVVFGCGHDNYGDPLVGTGILGLGYGEYSLVHRFGTKFSYCFGSLDDPSYPHNVLVLGDDGANILGDTTPLEIENGFYYVTVEAISMDGTMLPINPGVFQRNYQTGFGGTIIDTGNSLTSLVKEAYEPLKNKIEEVFDGRFTTADVNQEGMFKVECYNGDYERDLVESGFPTVTFHLSDGAELSLDVKSVFMKVAPNLFCLAVTPSIGNMNSIGATAQQNYNIGYDLEAKKISFERIDCGVLFDY